MSNIITSIQFKRGTKSVLDARLVQADLGIPANGEPIYETDTSRLKIGDGIHSYVDLPYFGNDTMDNLVLEGYYDPSDQSFYDKPAEDVGRQKLVEWSSKLYKDIPTNNIYYFKAVGRFIILCGNAKLYNTHGQNVDGAMTQKCVTDAIDDISFNIDENDTECLILNKPW